MFVRFLRYNNWLYRHHLKILALINYFFFRMVFACNVHPRLYIEKGISFPHYGLGVVIHPKTKIGKNCKIYQNVTIGYRNGEGPPTIGENVLIGTGSVILGDIKIGNNVRIGANAVVLQDVPDNCTVVGNPSRVIVRGDDK